MTTTTTMQLKDPPLVDIDGCHEKGFKSRLHQISDDGLSGLLVDGVGTIDVQSLRIISTIRQIIDLTKTLEPNRNLLAASSATTIKT
jgi:hypothetical protein